MELRQLEYFVTVAEELHFSKAAEKLHITQQALSFQIKQLEEELEVSLFHRTTRNVEITVAGRELLSEIMLVFDHLQQGVAKAKKAAQGEVGQLSIGYVSTTLHSITPYYVRIFRECFPEVKLTLHEMVSPAIENSLLSGDIDICLSYLPKEIDQHIAYEIIHQERAVVAMPRNHFLAQLDKIPFHLLADEPFIMYSRKYKKETYDTFIALCQSAGFSPNIIQDAASESAIISLVAAGLGITITTESVTSVHSENVVYRLVTEPSFETSLIVGWDRNNTSPVVREFVRITKENHYHSKFVEVTV